MSPPILSRSTVITMRTETSFRDARNTTVARHLGLACCPPPLTTLPAWSDIPRLRKEGEDPYRILNCIIATYGLKEKSVQTCLKAIGAGSSPWIQVSNFLLQTPPASAAASQ
jgi:hypothetical protein